jgi:hypothetical protein
MRLTNYGALICHMNGAAPEPKDRTLLSFVRPMLSRRVLGANLALTAKIGSLDTLLNSKLPFGSFPGAKCQELRTP